MKKPDLRISSVFSGLATGVAVLLVTTTASNLFLNSTLYSKSRLIRMILSQDLVGITELAGNKQNVDLLLKFVGGLTSAYIDFELIPVNEVGTFAAVFESAQGGVVIDKFEYHRKNLTISGSANTMEDYGAFLSSLRDTEYFESVSGHFYISTDDRIQFDLECASRTSSVSLDFG